MNSDAMEKVISQNARSLHNFVFSKALRLLVLAPHPDDFDAIGVTLRFFLENQNPIYVAVATSGARGVEDTFCSTPTPQAKTKIREQEQRASCRYFGLPATHLSFLRLAEDQNGNLRDNDANANRVKQHFLNKRPHLVFLPHWHDKNRAHQMVYAMFRKVALEAHNHLVVFLNRDPKTIQMQCDLYHGFGEDKASWKKKLLGFHRSQQQRNLNQRGYGMDERILSMDQDSAELCSVDAPYAEIFELEFLGGANLEDFLQ